MKRVLVAGIGNIFLGDDGFGCEVIRRLTVESLPPEVQVIDFGIRSHDLAYALTDDYETIILVDATARGEPPGTVYLVELDPGRLDDVDSAEVDAHSMNPVRVLQMAQSLRPITGKVYLVGCEPASLERDDGQFLLSLEVRQAIPDALATIKKVVNNELSLQMRDGAGAHLA